MIRPPESLKEEALMGATADLVSILPDETRLAIAERLEKAWRRSGAALLRELHDALNAFYERDDYARHRSTLLNVERAIARYWEA